MMARDPRKTGGVFCIESWSSDLRIKSTVRPVLELLEVQLGMPFVHQRVASADELAHYLQRWSEYDSYPVAYLAMHGSQGGVHPGSAEVGFHELALALRDSEWSQAEVSGHTPDPLDLSRKTLYLGSCSTLAGDKRLIERLRRETGLDAVCGFTRDVDWLASAAFEIRLLGSLYAYRRSSPKRAFTALRSEPGARGSARELGFRTVTRWDRAPAFRGF